MRRPFVKYPWTRARLDRRAKLSSVGTHLLVFIGVAAIVIVLPGPDTAVVTKNILVPWTSTGGLASVAP